MSRPFLSGTIRVTYTHALRTPAVRTAWSTPLRGDRPSTMDTLTTVNNGRALVVNNVLCWIMLSGRERERERGGKRTSIGMTNADCLGDYSTSVGRCGWRCGRDRMLPGFSTVFEARVGSYNATSSTHNVSSAAEESGRGLWVSVWRSSNSLHRAPQQCRKAKERWKISLFLVCVRLAQQIHALFIACNRWRWWWWWWWGWAWWRWSLLRPCEKVRHGGMYKTFELTNSSSIDSNQYLRAHDEKHSCWMKLDNPMWFSLELYATCLPLVWTSIRDRHNGLLNKRSKLC